MSLPFANRRPLDRLALRRPTVVTFVVIVSLLGGTTACSVVPLAPPTPTAAPALSLLATATPASPLSTTLPTRVLANPPNNPFVAAGQPAAPTPAVGPNRPARLTPPVGPPAPAVAT